MAFNTGENIGSYRVMEKLGRGGMATVYKAYHAKLDRYVALKVLHPAFLEDPNFLARFQREARLVAKLEHPNIVPVYDFAEHEEQPYLVMKYIEGETLKAYLNRGRLEVDQIWNVVDAVGAGLAHAHNEGILHRDVKPSNVIVANDGKIYLADFGLARIAQSGESTLSSDMIMGTPQYISPEQAKGEKNLDNGTDIYSFAVMLYEMVVGEVPFSADTPFSIIHDHIYSPLPLPHLVNPSVPDEVERVLLKALAKERADRYENVEDLNAAFKQAWNDADVDMAEVTMTSPIQEIKQPEPTPPPIPTSTLPQDENREDNSASATPTKKKRKLWLSIIGGLVLLCLCLLAVVAILDNQSDEPFEREQPELNLPAPADNAPNAPPPLGENTSPRIEEAQKWISESPNDPYAHLELALALLDDAPEQKQLISQTLNKAGNLAGDDIGFFEGAGFDLLDRELWTGSAVMFLRTLEIAQGEGIVNEEIIYFFHESAYKAAGLPETPKFLPFEKISRVDKPMSLIVEARHTLYHGNPEDALSLLREAKKLNPGFPEALLLEAEIHIRGKRIDKARQTLEQLLRIEQIPEWIFVEAEDALNQLP